MKYITESYDDETLDKTKLEKYGNIITDKILGKENPYEDVYLSTRFHPIKNKEELDKFINSLEMLDFIKRVSKYKF